MCPGGSCGGVGTGDGVSRKSRPGVRVEAVMVGKREIRRRLVRGGVLGEDRWCG